MRKFKLQPIVPRHGRRGSAKSNCVASLDDQTHEVAKLTQFIERRRHACAAHASVSAAARCSAVCALQSVYDSRAAHA
eukprot:6202031-Pleurochrysis_carterae.AAC.2